MPRRSGCSTPLTIPTEWSTSFREYLSPTLSVVGAQRQPLIPHASFKLETVKEGAPDKAPSPAAVAPTDSTQWSLKGLFWLQPSTPGDGGMGRGGGGGFPGGGSGFPGGGDFPRRGGGAPSRPLMQLSPAGQLWMASWNSQTDLPEKALHNLTILITEELLPQQSPLRQAWQDEFNRKKALPLAATITSMSGSPTLPPTDSGASAPLPQPLPGAAPQGAAHFHANTLDRFAQSTHHSLGWVDWAANNTKVSFLFGYRFRRVRQPALWPSWQEQFPV